MEKSLAAQTQITLTSCSMRENWFPKSWQSYSHTNLERGLKHPKANSCDSPVSLKTKSSLSPAGTTTTRNGTTVQGTARPAAGIRPQARFHGREKRKLRNQGDFRSDRFLRHLDCRIILFRQVETFRVHRDAVNADFVMESNA